MSVGFSRVLAEVLTVSPCFICWEELNTFVGHFNQILCKFYVQFMFTVLLFCPICLAGKIVEFGSEILTGGWSILAVSCVKISRDSELF